MKEIDTIFLHYDRFVQELNKAIFYELPGVDAQMRAAPPNRAQFDIDKARMDPRTRRAAVMAIIHPLGNVPHLLLTKRREYPGVHGGQIAFPGGKVDESDIYLLSTASRETGEEVGVGTHCYSVWRALTEIYIPPSRFLVQPFIGIAHHELNFTLEEREVERLIQVPLQWLVQEDYLVPQKIDLGGVRVQVPGYMFSHDLIWGATAMMISELSELLKLTFKSR